MSRLNLSNNAEPKVVEKTEDICTISLDAIIPVYVEDKKELEHYKKTCEDENAKIKALMLELGEDSYVTGKYTAKRIVTNRESINEDKLLVILKKHNIEGVIKTKEYVDMDALEAYLYDHEATNDFATDLASCKTSTEVVQLRVSVKKEK